MLSVDLNGDGNEEILAINETNDRLKLFVGDNLGRLTRQSDLLTGRAPQAIATSDLNGDGQPELITANRVGRSISVFSGNLSSGYVPVDYPVGSAPVDVASADVNDDGFTDLVVLDEVEQALCVYLGDGSSSLGTPTAIALGDVPGRFVLADANGDGTIDAVITLVDSNRLMILPSVGLQPATAPIYVSLTHSPADVAVVDLYDDGNPDLATPLPGDNALSILYGRGNQQFAKAQRIVVGERPTRVTLADADSAYVDVSYTHDVIAQDAESTTLTYALMNAPAGATTGRLSWIPAASAVGSHEFIVEVTDEAGASTTATWSVEVSTATATVLPLDVSLPRATAAVVADYFSRIRATDQLGRPVSWSLSSGPIGLTVESDGTIEWTPSSNQLGTQSVELAATTVDGNTETITFEIEVTGRPLNAPPSIDSAPLLSVSLGQRFKYDMIAPDSDRDVLAFTLLEAPIGMSVHPSLGHVRWTPARDQLGEHTVLLQVSDPLGATATQDFTLNVSRFGGPPRRRHSRSTSRRVFPICRRRLPAMHHVLVRLELSIATPYRPPIPSTPRFYTAWGAARLA